MSKSNSKCLNTFNDYYYEEFLQLSKDAKEKNNRNLQLIYKKVSISIQKYPFPILSAAQATLLEGVGETLSKQFEKILCNYKEKIQIEKINYLEQSFQLNTNVNNPKKFAVGKRKAQTDTESDSKNRSNLKKRKRLTNINPYSSVWTSVVSAYILNLQNNSVILEFDDVMAMSRTITEELRSVKKIESSEGMNDFKYMKGLNLLENVDLKEKKIKINDFLIKLAKIELKKCGMVVENDGSGALNFSLIETEKKEEVIFLNRINEDIYINNCNIYSQMPPENNDIMNSSFNDNRNNNSTNQSQSFSQSISSKNNSSLNNSTLDSFVKSSKNITENKFKEDDGIYSASNSFIRVKTDNNINFNNIEKNIKSNVISKNNKIPCISYHPNNITNYFNKNSLTNKIISNFSQNQTRNLEEISNFPEKINLSTSPSNSLIKFRKFKQSQSSIPKNNIILLIDNREKGPNGENIMDEISKIKPNIVIKERNLAVGDFMWVYTDPESELEFVLDFIIERKTTEDLAKSILDGRYNEQKYRLKNCGIKNIFYMFEAGSSPSLLRGNFSKQSMTTAIFNTLNIHDINIIRTFSLEESLNAILKLDKMIRFHGNYYSSLIESDTKFDKKILYSEFTQNNAKTKHSTIENIFVRQLRCFEDCGAKSVEILRKVFKCPRYIWELLREIEEDETKENLITAASYIVENNISLNTDNLIHYAKVENFKGIKKEVKSVKKIRKSTNYSIITFYS